MRSPTVYYGDKSRVLKGGPKNEEVDSRTVLETTRNRINLSFMSVRLVKIPKRATRF